jgi:uncharacterized protein YprB with RNaseH-like and TPR domain
MNIAQLKKAELVWLSTHRCKAHSHKFIEHPQCYDLEYPLQRPGGTPERIGMLDIEATNLSAEFGYTFSYAIKKLDGPVLGRVLTPKEIRSFQFDKELMKEFCRDVKQFDKIITHYGTDRRFDIPFLRTRCLRFDLDFPLYKEISVDDTWPMSRNKLKLTRNRLENICVFLNIPAKGHKMNPDIWCKALSGHKPSLEYIWAHNVEDVESLEAVWKRLHKYVPDVKRSI